ncbi:MAG: SiaC family regulatory phosphoprotein, partial [Raineya sp.]
MENLVIKATEQTAEVVLDAIMGKIEFSGVSIPEDSYSFFTPILRWIDQYNERPQKKTV